MNKTLHRIYVYSLAAIVILVTIYLAYTGYDYYNTPLEERFYHPRHDWFKPSGAFGHGLGIIGTLLILFGVSIYIARKRYNFMAKYLNMKYLLEFHIFLCSLGPVLILFHTAFKFGGIVSIAFWSMVAVVLSGVIGRFIYIQIPRTIEGRAMSLNEVQELKGGLADKLKNDFNLDDDTSHLLLKFTLEQNYVVKKRSIYKLRKALRKKDIPKNERKEISAILNNELSLSGKIKRLERMEQLFKYWHVAHLPFALIMLIILIIHVAITLTFGYKWIF